MIEVIIEKTLNNEYIVSEASEYLIPVYTTKTQNKTNIFGELLNNEFQLTNNEIRYKAGDALSCGMSYEDCVDFINKNKLVLITLPLHSPAYTYLDSRYFR